VSVLPRPVAATDALVLRAWPAGETSVVASLLTERHGYLRVIAKGARAAASAVRPLVQPGRLVAVECGLDAARELQYLRGGAVLLDPLADGNSLERTAFLLGAVELLDRCRPAGDQEAALFPLCRDFAQMLSCAAPEACGRLYYALELGLLALHGLAPELVCCAACGSDPHAGPGAAAFSPAAGGVVCAGCARRGRVGDARFVSPPALALLRTLAPGLAGAVAACAGGWVAREAGVLLHRFLDYHLPGYRLPAGFDLLRAGRGAAGPDLGREEDG